MPSHKYKTPNRRRLSKWINRTRRTILRANARGFCWFINQLQGESERNAAALRAGVNLAAAAGYYLPASKPCYAELDAMFSRLTHRAFLQFPSEWMPSRQNLEI